MPVDYNVEKVRSQFPFLKSSPAPIYFDNAATTQKPQVVIDAINDFYINHNGNAGRGIHRLARQASDAYEAARQTVAKFMNAQTEEIVFTSGTTGGINLLATMLADQIQPGDMIATTITDHHSNFLPWQKLAKLKAAELKIIPIDKNFQLVFDDLITISQTKRLAVVALPYISNVLGTINPLTEIVKRLRSINHDVQIIIDAAQAVAHKKIDFKTLDCDFLTFSAHKMYGPLGIGVLYGKTERLTQLSPIVLGGGMIDTVTLDTYSPTQIPECFEAGTPNVAGAIGLAAGINWINNIGVDTIAAHERELVKYLCEKLTPFAEHGLNIIRPADVTIMPTSIVSFYVKEIDSHDLATFFDDDNIMVRSGKHCAHPLHDTVLPVDNTLRISFAAYNTKAEIDLFIASLQNALQLLA